jgi:hypothetical protein
MWAVVASRLHNIHKIFPFGSGSNELMLHGSVAFVLKDGRKAEVSLVALTACGWQDFEGRLILTD